MITAFPNEIQDGWVGKCQALLFFLQKFLKGNNNLQNLSHWEKKMLEKEKEKERGKKEKERKTTNNHF